MYIMKNILFILSTLLFGFSCSPHLSPFTQELYQSNNWTVDDLKQIQFYLSKDIVLYRKVSKGESTIHGGKIKIKKGQKIEEIIIEAGTPGIVLFSPKKDRIAVSFESSGTDKYLIFGPNPKVGERYVLLAKDWKKRKGKISYDDKIYFTDSESAYASLLVDLKKVRKVSLSKRKANGRTL